MDSGAVVLVMTDAEDFTSDLIVAALLDRGTRVMRFDPGSGPIRMETFLEGRAGPAS